jgi:hypothetical protein
VVDHLVEFGVSAFLLMYLKALGGAGDRSVKVFKNGTNGVLGKVSG